MTTSIELHYQLRKKFRGAHILGLIIFTLAWIARSVYKTANLDIENVHLVIFIVLLFSLAYLAFYAIRLNMLEHRIRSNPDLKEALYDELFRLNELKAWRTAFFSVIGFNVVIAILSLFIHFEDLMLIFITVLLIGFGSYSLTLYLLDR